MKQHKVTNSEITTLSVGNLKEWERQGKAKSPKKVVGRGNKGIILVSTYVDTEGNPVVIIEGPTAKLRAVPVRDNGAEDFGAFTTKNRILVTLV